MSQTFRIAVYGTLRIGGRLNYHLDGSRHIGMARTVAPYKMISHNDGYPELLELPGACPVVVDLYEVDGETLKCLDRIERHPYWYCRKQVTIQSSDGKAILGQAWIYFMQRQPRTDAKVVENGDWIEYEKHL